MRHSLLALQVAILAAGCGGAGSPTGVRAPTKYSPEFVQAVQAEMPEGALVDENLSVWCRGEHVSFVTRDKKTDEPWEWRSYRTFDDGARSVNPVVGTVTPDNRVERSDWNSASREVVLAVHPGFRRAVQSASIGGSGGHFPQELAAKLEYATILAYIPPSGGRKGVLTTRTASERRSDRIAIWFTDDPEGEWRVDAWWQPYAEDDSKAHYQWWVSHADQPGAEKITPSAFWPPLESTRWTRFSVTGHKQAGFLRAYLKSQKR